MSQKDLVEKADGLSRQRPLILGYFALLFVLVSVSSGPFFAEYDEPTARQFASWWAVGAAMLLAILATGGGVFNRSEFRALLNDEVWRANRAMAVSVGYWVAMVVALGVYLAPALQRLTAREAIYVIVTPSITLALLTLAWLERRAHRGA